MKKVILEHISYILLLGLLLPSWHILYAPEHAKPINHEQQPLITTVSKTYRKNNVFLQVKVLNKSAISYLFQFSPTFLCNLALANDIVPIQIIIKNNGKEQCFIEPKDIEASMLSYQKIVHLSQQDNQWEYIGPQKKIFKITSIIGSTIGSIGGALFGLMVPHISFGIFAFCTIFGATAGLVGGLGWGVYGTFFYTIGKTVKSLINIIRMKRMIKKNTLYKKVAIKPGKEYSACIFFVQQDDSTPSITIHHKNKDKTATRFDLDLLSPTSFC